MYTNRAMMTTAKIAMHKEDTRPRPPGLGMASRFSSSTAEGRTGGALRHGVFSAWEWPPLSPRSVLRVVTEDGLLVV